MPAFSRFRPLRAALLLLALALSACAVPARAVPAGFDHAVTFTVAGYTNENGTARSALADFPVLVRISETAIPGFRYDDVRSPTGDDVCFVAADGTPLAFEIDTWDPISTSLAWVRLPSMENETPFVMCYGSESSGKDVCDDNPWSAFTAVWHMGEEGNGKTEDPITIHDSTTNGLDGLTRVGSTASGVFVGGARLISSSSGHAPGIIVDATNGAKRAAADALGADFHASFWYRAKSASPWGYLVSRRKGEQGKSWGFLFDGSSTLMRVYAGSTTYKTTSGTYNLGTTLSRVEPSWKKVDIAWRYDENADVQYADIYLNGAYLETVACNEKVNIGDDANANIGIGCSTQDSYSNSDPGKGRCVNGEMDEVRLGAFVPTEDWIAADYATQSDASFLSNGGVKSVYPSVPLVIGERGAPACAAGAGKWFDAGVAALSAWPSDGSDVPVVSNGTWTGTAGATLVVASHVLDVNAFPGADAMVAFVPEAGRTATAAAPVSFLSTATITGLAPAGFLPSLDASAKGALAVAEDGDGQPRYYGWAKDPAGAENVWRALDRATPPLSGSAASLKAVAKFDEGLFVRYEADGAVLSAGGAEWLPVVADDGDLDFAGLLGDNFAVASLVAGTLGGPVEVAITNLPDHVSVASVTADGVPVDPVGGVYTVDSGASVVVTFAADPGYALAGAPTLAIMPFEGTEIPVESVPAAVRPNDLVRINEIMASNPSPDKGGLVSELGIAEMDWIELYNGYSQDIDATGWFLSDNAKPGKETKATILGSCVIPAGGYKIVWLDKIHTNAVEYAADEAFAVLKLSSDGDLIQIADAGTNVIQKIDFQTQRQIKGFSYGPLSVRSGADLVPGDGPCVYMRNATPGAPNVTQGWGGFTPEVAFSEPHGWKTEAFDLTLTCPDDPAAAIYYTLDGTSPTTASHLYTNAIHVSKTTVVRAAVPDPTSVLQQDNSATYLFLDDILAQSQSASAPAEAVGFPDSGTVTNLDGKTHTMLYGLLQSVVNGSDRERLLRGFTNTISTISLVVDPANLFDGSTGIYVNPKGEGREWERQTMLEIFDPKGVAANVTIPAGLRIRGGNSRNPSWPKHSFRFFFRSEYGRSSLDAKLFLGESVKETGSYDKLDLRTSQNLSWANGKNAADTFVTEVFARDSQRDMGQPYTRSRYYNLFINGQYWGLYQTQERGDEHWGEAYLGGDSLQYDLIKAASSWPNHNASLATYSIECNEGTWDAWSNLWEIATTEGFGEGHEDNYNKVLGLDANGDRDPTLPILLNPESLMSFMFSTHFMVDQDGPTSPYSGSDKGHPNNFNALRNRDDAGDVNGFVFLRHDAEVSMGMNGSNTAYDKDPTFWGTEAQKIPAVTPSPAKFLQMKYFTPAELNYRLMQNPVYRRAYGDAFYRFFLKEGGAMTVEESTRRYAARMAEIDDAIVCEAARWGQGKTRSNWQSACNKATTFISMRVDKMKEQYQDVGWYPTNQPPRFVDARGEPYADGDVVPDGERVFLAGLGEGTNIWYTLDGSDPLDIDGQPAATAAAYTAEGFALEAQFTTVRARSVALGEASALAEITLEQEPAAPSDLMLGIRVAGIMNACASDGDTDDFIILTNLLDRAVSLEDLRIVSMSTGDPESKASVAFTLGETDIAPNGTMTLMANPWWFDKPQPASASKTCKLKNGDIDVVLWDTNRTAVVQTATVSGNWWPLGTAADGKVKYACKQTGAHFVAKVFDRNPVVQDDWRPSFIPPLAGSAGFAGVTAAAVDPDVKAWLDELGSTESGQAAITAFAGTTKALASCYLANVDPLTEGVVLSISGFAFTNGEARIDGTLTTNGTPLEAGHRVRGSVRLYYSGSVTNLDDATDFVEVDPPSFPVEATNEVSGAEIPAARFYRLKIEK